VTVDRTGLLLDLIREATTDALTFVDGLSLEDFDSDPMRRYAVAMCLVVIGENVGRLAPYHSEFLTANPQTPWTQAIGMQNRIAHGYHDLDFVIVWRTVTQYLPELLKTLPASRL